MKKAFPFLFFGILLFFFYTIYLNLKPFIANKLKGYYSLEEIEINGLVKKNPKEILDKIKQKKKALSLLTLNEEKYRKDIENDFNDIKVVEIIKVYPHTLHVILNEKDTLFLISLSGYFFGVDDKGKIIVYNRQSDVFSYDEMIVNIDVSKQLKKEIVVSTKEEKKFFLQQNIYLMQLVMSLVNFPKQDQDWFIQISNIDLNRKILYTRDGFQMELEDFTIDSLRKARYFYSYLRKNEVSSANLYTAKEITKYAVQK